MSGNGRYTNLEIHLCEECGEKLAYGNRIVCFSDGYVVLGEEYDPSNRRFWHVGCWNRINPVEEDTSAPKSTGRDQP